jgi:hypothetical protein
LPPRLIVYGIAGASFATGAGLSEEVRLAVGGLVARVRAEALALAFSPDVDWSRPSGLDPW